MLPARCLLIGALCLRLTPIVTAAETPSSAAILQQLRQFREMGSVLMVAAHPDDENTQLITYLARGRGSRMAYLSVTRGDGGQNVIGPEFGDELGVIRTQELLAARRLDGGQQFFTRARDFGYSKDYQQTLTKWDRPQVVADVVRVIREFRPDVVVTRFSPLPSGTHGHHTASAVLAIEAFKLAGDPKAFPEQLAEGLTPWQPKRILLNGGGPRGGGGGGADAVQLDVGGDDPVTGESFAAIAGRSRSMHKSQGFGNFGGGRGGGGARSESFTPLGGEPASKDIFDGVDTTWNRELGGEEISKLIEEAIAKFNPQDPSASVPALLAIKSRVDKLPSDPLVNDKRAQLDRVLQHCLGLTAATTTDNAEVVPGESMHLHATVVVQSSIPVKWIGLRYPASNGETRSTIDLKPGQASSRDVTETLPANTLLTQPYWLRKESTAGMFQVDDATLIGRPENPPIFPIEQIFEVGGQTLVIPDEPVVGERQRRLDAVPPVSLGYVSDVQLFAPGASREVQVVATAYRANVAGTLRLEAPDGWKVSPASQPFKIAQVGQTARFTFTVTAPSQPATAGILASAEVNGVRYSNQRIAIDHAHIPFLLLQPPARLKAVCLELAIRGRKIGYLPGAGDDAAQSLEQMGYTVTTLTGGDLTPEKMRSLDAVVVGVRAFNVRTDLVERVDALFSYVENGGTVVEQYNAPSGLKVPELGPYELRLAGDLPAHRVTNEKAPVTLLAPNHPAFNTPNKITSADFDGWVQERGLNFPSQWDTNHFTALLSCSDPGEAPLTSGLLASQYGKGHFVYTGLSFFRQLPAGVPGAYRLFANLVSLGK